MKKLFMVMLVLFAVVVISGCKKEEEPGKFDYADGKYFALADEADDKGYRYWTVVTINNKKITDIEWNAYNVDGGESKCKGDDKITCSEDGTYDMGGDKGEWHEQAEKAIKWVIKNQKIGKDLTFNGDKVDAISTVSITTKEMFDLIDDALAAGPVQKGDFKEDGYYYYESGRDDSKPTSYVYAKGDANGNVVLDSNDKIEVLTGSYVGYTFGTFVIVNGRLVVADFNASYTLYDSIMDENNVIATVKAKLVDGKYVVDATGDISLKIAKPNANGEYVKFLTKDPAGLNYGMRSAGGEWDVQAEKVEAKLLSSQGLTITVTEGSGVVDGVSGVSVGHSVASFKDILDKLANDAK